MLIYLAGPDVFRPNAQEWAEDAKALCRRYGYNALFPLDAEESRPDKIYTANIAMIRRAQIVVANLDPFRGAEPDSGTCFELGYAAALGKRLFGYTTIHTTVIDRVKSLSGQVTESADSGSVDAAGWSIEDFNLPVNLMLAMTATLVAGSLEIVSRRSASPSRNRHRVRHGKHISRWLAASRKRPAQRPARTGNTAPAG